MDERRIEELLEELYLRQVEGQGGAMPPFADEVIEAARRRGYVESRPGASPELTPAGTNAARGVVRRHRLAERLLCDVLNVDAEEMEEDACRFEHVLKQDVEDKVCALLGHPATCPHGKPIPEGACCRQHRADVIRRVGPLCDGEVGCPGIVAYLSTRDEEDVRKLMAMGILPGVGVRLLRRFPSYVFQVGYSQFAVDRELAEKIFVHWLPEKRGQAVAPTPPRRRRGRWGRRDEGG